MKKGLSIEECVEKDIKYYVYDKGWYKFVLDGKYTLYKPNGERVEGIDGHGWYKYKIDDKYTLCKTNGEIVFKDVDLCSVSKDYYTYGEWIDDWEYEEYKKNFDGSDYEE